MRYGALLFVLAWLLVGCSDDTTYTDVAEVRSELIDGLKSYSRIEDVAQSLNPPENPWQIIYDSTSPSMDRRPPFNFVTARISGYRSGRHRGDLVLTFFNDRLMETLFYPDDFDGYRIALPGSPSVVDLTKEISIGSHTRVRMMTDFEGRRYVAWIDVRLRDQQLRWIGRYA